jgi:hypothetical protein
MRTILAKFIISFPGESTPANFTTSQNLLKSVGRKNFRGNSGISVYILLGRIQQFSNSVAGVKARGIFSEN